MREEIIIKQISQRLQAERLSLNLSQHALADRAGVSRRTIVQAETGHNTSVSTLVRLLIALGATHLLEPLVSDPDGCPIEPAKMDGKKRRRASRPRKPQMIATPTHYNTSAATATAAVIEEEEQEESWIV